MRRDPGLYIDDTLESINLIEEYTKDLTEENFSRDTLAQDAVIRRLEIIGEAVNKLPRELTQNYPDIP